MANFSFLSTKDLDDCLTLQATVMDELKERGQTHFIIERPRDYFEQQVQSPNSLLGVRNDDNTLIAQSIFYHADALNPDYIKGITLKNWKLCDPVSTMQGAIIHPDARGQKLLSRMIDAWIGWANDKGYSHILTRVEESNERSLSSFTKAGLYNAGSILDARDGATVHVLHKNLGEKNV